MSTYNIHALLHSVPKLSGASDYQDWKFAIGMVLRRAGSYDIVTGTTLETSENSKDWKAMAEEGLTIIGLTVTPGQYSHIRDCKNGPEAWKALAAIYEKDSRATRISLKRQIYGFRHDPDAPMQEYITAITNLAARLGSLSKDNTLTPTEITDILIFNLHESYSNIAATLTATKGELSVADVTGALLDEEGRQAGSVLIGPSNYRRRGEMEVAYAANGGREFKCFNCGKTGHIARNCRSSKKREEDEAKAAWEYDDYDDIW